MIALWVKVRVKARERGPFLEAIETDALGSERDEPGCLRFNVLQDSEDREVYYFYEVYRDRQALDAHRHTPHFKAWLAVRDRLGLEPEVRVCDTVFPADGVYWSKRDLSG